MLPFVGVTQVGSFDSFRSMKKATRSDGPPPRSFATRVRDNAPTTSGGGQVAEVSSNAVGSSLAENQGRQPQLTLANRALRRTIDRLAAVRDLSAFLHEVLAQALDLAGSCSGAIFTHDPATDTLVGPAIIAEGVPFTAPDEVADPFPAALHADWMRAREIRELIVCGIDIEHEDWWPGAAEWHRANGSRALVIAPLLLGDQVIGCLSIISQRPTSEISAAQRESVTTLAQQATLALAIMGLADQAKQAAVAREQERSARDRAAEMAMVNATLQQSVEELSRITDVRPYVGDVLQTIVTHAGASGGLVWRCERATGLLSCEAAVVDGAQVNVASDERVAILRRGWHVSDYPDAWQVIDAPGGFYYGRLARDDPGIPSEMLAWHMGHGHHSTASLLLKRGDAMVGVLRLFFADEIDMAPPTIALARALAQHVTMALELARLAAESIQVTLERQKASELARANQALRKTLDSLVAAPEVAGLLRQILAEAMREMVCQDGAVFLYDEATETLRVTETIVEDDLPPFTGPFPASAAPFWQRLLTAREPIISEPGLQSLNRNTGNTEWHRRRGNRAVVAAPLRLGDRLIGCVVLALQRGPDQISPGQVEMVKALATQAALALELTRLGDAERLAAVAAERNHLAREIHDTLAQGLALIVMQLGDAEAKLGPLWSVADKPLNTVRELAIDSLAYARRSVGMLRLSVAAGLPRAIRDLVESTRRHFAGAVALRVTGNTFLLDVAAESALAGIAREALTNAARHSGASQVAVEVAFTADRAVRLVVTDNGIGFDPNATPGDTYGLIGMQERASRAGVSLTFVTEPGAGTEVIATWSCGTPGG
jgi:signal transduction histidine kinase